MKAYERLQIAGPWLLGITFFVLAGLAIQLSTVQLRSVTFLYGSEQVLPDGPASFRGVVYDPLMNRTKEGVEGRWSSSVSKENLAGANHRLRVYNRPGNTASNEGTSAQCLD